jgi:methylthioribose-1-phosphate isomerase
MKKIQKHVIQSGRHQVMIPSDRILSAGSFHNKPVLYALADTEDQFDRPYEVAVYETDQDIDELDGFSFAGTVIMEDGRILHVFYKGISSMDL